MAHCGSDTAGLSRTVDLSLDQHREQQESP